MDQMKLYVHGTHVYVHRTHVVKDQLKCTYVHAFVVLANKDNTYLWISLDTLVQVEVTFHDYCMLWVWENPHINHST